MINWIIKLIPSSAIRKYVGSIVRHGLTVLAGILAGYAFPGVADLAKLILENMDHLEGAVVAIVMGVVGLLMSFAEKKDK